MGCCQCKNGTSPSGFILPEQEMVINDLEQSHPFSAFEADQLFEVFSVWGTSGEMQEKDFFSACEYLSIPADTFYSINSPCTLYMYELKASPTTISIQKLLVTGILLSKSDWECKLQLLLIIYEYNGVLISQYGLCSMLDSLIYASTVILPSMSLSAITKQNLNYYIERLVFVRPALIDKVLLHFGDIETFSEQTLFEFLRENTQFQKLFWSNGIRLMLVEEDAAPSASDSSMRTPIREVSPFSEISGRLLHSEDITKVQSVTPSIDASDADITKCYPNKN